MKLKEAEQRMKAGYACYANYYGKGWKTIYANGEFWDVNPVTGSKLLHIFDGRDYAAKWANGASPKDH